MLASILRKLATGALYGVGFATAFLAVTLLVLGNAGTFFPGRLAAEQPASTAASDSDLTNQLIFETHRAGVDALGKLEIVASVENKGPSVPDYVNIYADLFDSEGKFLYQCTHQFRTLESASKQNFIIDCFRMNKELVPRYSKHQFHARRMR